MNPTFTIQVIYDKDPCLILDEMMHVENWSSFQGEGIIPGIKQASFVKKMDTHIGCIIKVENSDGSSHIEEFLEYEKDRYLKIKMHQFSKPLSLFAEYFIEEWLFEKQEFTYFLNRTLTLYGKGFFSNLFLSLVAKFLKKAIEKHTQFLIHEVVN
jgi:hypothetical protein